MKKGTKKALAISILLCAGAVCAAAEGEFPLEYTETADFNDPVLSLAGTRISAYGARPRELKGVPAELPGKAKYHKLWFGRRGVWAIVLADTKQLYIDTDLDNDLSDEKALTARTAPTVRGRAPLSTRSARPAPTVRGAGDEFDPIALKVSPGADSRRVKVRLKLVSGGYVRGRPAGFRTGKVTLEGKDYAVALVDSNWDGRYDGLWRDWSSDTLAIDVNRDGRMARAHPDMVEVAPLSKLRRIDGTWYVISVAADGSKIALEKTEPEFGTFRADVGDVDMSLYSDNGFHRLSGRDGKWPLPVGDYRISSLTLEQKDEEGHEWSVGSTSRQLGILAFFSIRAGETHRVTIGPPFTLKTDVSRSGGTVYIGVNLTGRGGEQYSAGAEKDGRRMEAPKFKILDESGKTLASGSFKYG